MAEAGRETIGTVRDWMTRNPVGVPLDTPVASVVRVMRTEGIRHVLVMDGERVAGIVSNRDVRGSMADEGAVSSPASTAAAIMSEPVISVSAETPLVGAAREMLDRKIGALPVLDESRVVGILTRADALEALLVWAEGAGGPRD